ncbi:immunity 52 family protein [Gilliamella sp. B2776]|uniref:Imm52 family immunity protein n=1 Tax=unclassified Gilliamella TaxID=2685620 RepID=UPI00226AB9E3|nr:MULTISPECIES: Imm52 family immunity protein [unclassified Gilliamella]MCX8650117.1 immunity 52 family protein [Gilliamella sp. B2779]MCX8692012.1 immunity 52 family protein [Gilliamella sp. B2776]MCX8703170.1 immunity 52 family protein [Gilliamella sp. B2781]WDM19797.1 immunity 52 family protein [Gilliamella sp. B3022]
MKKELAVEMYFKPEAYLPLSVCIAQIEQILKIQHNYLHKSENWYLCGASKKKSSIYQIFDENGITEVGLKKLTLGYKKEHNSFDLAVWDKDTEEAALSYFLYEKTFEKRFFLKIYLSFTIDITITKSQTVTAFILALVQKFNSAYIMVNGNYLPQKAVFPDRLSAGWMIYLPKAQLTHEMVPESSDVVSVKNEDGLVTGTLVVTMPHFFDEENADDIKAVNRVDIRLRELDLLPLYTDM